MFAFASLLIEAKEFDQIDINFLIVGHTHASIDQYFSVLSKGIKKCAYIMSPLALKAVLALAHQDVNARPKLIKPIQVYYDYKSYFAPYINRTIKLVRICISLIEDE